MLARATKYKELKQRRRRRQREWQKSNRLAKQQPFTCITLFCTFLRRRCTTTTWKCLNSRFVEDRNTRQQLPFFFPELWWSLLEFNSKIIRPHLTNGTRWNKRNKVWSRANSLFLSDVFGELCVLKWQRPRVYESNSCAASDIKYYENTEKNLFTSTSNAF